MTWFPKHNAIPTSLNTYSCFDQLQYTNTNYIIRGNYCWGCWYDYV